MGRHWTKEECNAATRQRLLTGTRPERAYQEPWQDYQERAARWDRARQAAEEEAKP